MNIIEHTFEAASYLPSTRYWPLASVASISYSISFPASVASDMGNENFWSTGWSDANLPATIISEPRTSSRRYKIAPTQIFAAHTSQNTKRRERQGEPDHFDFLDPKQLAYFGPFKTVPHTGWYNLTIRCTAKDRGLYDWKKTGIYDGDPIQIEVQLGNRTQTFDLPDDEVLEIKLTEWLAAGSRLRLRYPTDGLTQRGNGNFKFQNA